MGSIWKKVIIILHPVHGCKGDFWKVAQFLFSCIFTEFNPILFCIFYIFYLNFGESWYKIFIIENAIGGELMATDLFKKHCIEGTDEFDSYTEKSYLRMDDYTKNKDTYTSKKDKKRLLAVYKKKDTEGRKSVDLGKTLPSRKQPMMDIADNLSKENNVTNKRMAEILSVQASTLTKIINDLDHDDNNPSRDQLLMLMLESPKCQSIEEVRRQLIRSRREDLYCKTCDKSVNIRNMALIYIFDLKNQLGSECPFAQSWGAFANGVLLHIANDLKLPSISPLSDFSDSKNFIANNPHCKKLIDEWVKNLQDIKPVSYRPLREGLVKIYLESIEEDQRPSITKFLQDFAEDLGYADPKPFTKAFSACSSRGPRHVVIHCGLKFTNGNIHMVNRLLREANFPILYLNDDEYDYMYLQQVNFEQV